MKYNKVNGVVKVLNGDHETQSPVKDIGVADKSNDGATQVYKRVRPKQGLDSTSGKRRTQTSKVFNANPVESTRQGSGLSNNMEDQCKELSLSVDETEKSPSEMSKNLDDQCRRLSVSADGIKKTPAKIKKTRSELSRELSVSVDAVDKSPPVRGMRTRAMSQKECKGPGDGMDRSSVQLRKVKSALSKGSSVENESNAGLRKTRSEAGKGSNVPGNGSEGISSQLIKFESIADIIVGDSSGILSADDIRRMSIESEWLQSESSELFDETTKVLDESAGGIKKSSIGIAKSNCEELIEYEEKTITSNLDNASPIKSPSNVEVTDDEDDWDEELEEESNVETETETIKEKKIGFPEQNAKKIVVEEKKIQESNLKSAPNSTTVKKQTTPGAIHPRIVSKPEPIPVEDGYCSVAKRHSKLQSLVDLVMWRDASKSAFIFGLGTFVIMSSSYTTDLNVSLISVLSYVGLIYLAVTFLFRSLIHPEVIDEDETGHLYVFGVEEAMWLLKMFLPYINEFLLKLRALFSGDPATTMKLAVLLFVLARCGSSITIWKMAKLGFFGAFTVPKICSSYSSQLSAFGKFWIRRVRDAWESCSHKKAVGFFIFTVMWNLSSVVARMWAVFMVFVAFKYYQQSLREEEDWIKDDDEEEISGKSSSSSPLVVVEEKKKNNSKKIIGGRIRRQGPGPTLLGTKKQKKPIS